MNECAWLLAGPVGTSRLPACRGVPVGTLHKEHYAQLVTCQPRGPTVTGHSWRPFLEWLWFVSTSPDQCWPITMWCDRRPDWAPACLLRGQWEGRLGPKPQASWGVMSRTSFDRGHWGTSPELRGSATTCQSARGPCSAAISGPLCVAIVAVWPGRLCASVQGWASVAPTLSWDHTGSGRSAPGLPQLQLCCPAWGWGGLVTPPRVCGVHSWGTRYQADSQHGLPQ